jgi:hypothetical protein
MRARHALVLSSALAFGLCVAVPEGQAAEAEQAGVSAAVRGQVSLTSVVTEQTRRPESGEEVFLGDAVATGQSSGLQILLLDETVFTVGEQAELVIDRYVYDPDQGTAELSASLLRGGLRFVSGRISETQPENVEIKLPSATVGVRGTIVTALETSEGAYVFLDGPAKDNDAFQREGQALVSAGGQSVTLSRTGFATFVPAGGVPQAPFRPNAGLRAQIQNAVGGVGGGEEGGEGEAGVGSPAQSSGATKAEGLQTAAFAQNVGSSQSSSSNVVPTVAESEAQTEPAAEVEPFDLETFEIPSVPSNLQSIATISELDSLSGGVSHYFGTGYFAQTMQDGSQLATPASGTIEVALEIDFDQRRIFGGNSYVQVQAGTIDWTETIDGDSFDDSVSGYALFSGSLTEPGDRIYGAVGLFNSDGEIASTAAAYVGYDDGAGNEGVGFVPAAERVSGAAPAPD